MLRRTTICLLATLVLASPALAGDTFAPKEGKIYAGVSDTGRKRDYRAFTDLVGTHVAVMQSFQTWGSWQEDHRQAWKRTETRGMLSISTTGSYEGAEVISPRQIRRGRGDGYLMKVGRELDAWDRPTYIRLLPEMNGHWNPYCAFNEDGSKRDAAHSTAQFRKAWIRSVLIIRGGPKNRINRKLRRVGMPPIRRTAHPPSRLATPKVSFVWVPQTHGSPNIRANAPRPYYPGRRYVDWIGADIYGSFPNFAGLDRFYGDFRRKPFVIGEWSPWAVDDPDFTHHLHEWVESNKRAQMMVYFQGFGDPNPFQLQLYPKSAEELRRQLKSSRYVKKAPDHHKPDKGPDDG